LFSGQRSTCSDVPGAACCENTLSEPNQRREGRDTDHQRPRRHAIAVDAPIVAHAFSPPCGGRATLSHLAIPAGPNYQVDHI
jgi:hypothetical protein